MQALEIYKGNASIFNETKINPLAKIKLYQIIRRKMTN